MPLLLNEETIRDKVTETLAWLEQQISRRIPLAEIEHVGSSAVPGVFTKGDVDLLVEVSDASFDEAHSQLRECFAYNPEMPPERRFVSFSGAFKGTDFGVQLCTKESNVFHFVEFRDALRMSPELARRYGQIKLRCQHASMDDYRAAKAAFIEEILAARKEEGEDTLKLEPHPVS